MIVCHYSPGFATVCHYSHHLRLFALLGTIRYLLFVVRVFQTPMIKPVAAPMRESEVLANTTWESLQRAGAIYCVPVGLVSALMCNYTYTCCDQRKT